MAPKSGHEDCSFCEDCGRAMMCSDCDDEGKMCQVDPATHPNVEFLYIPKEAILTPGFKLPPHTKRRCIQVIGSASSPEEGIKISRTLAGVEE